MDQNGPRVPSQEQGRLIVLGKDGADARVCAIQFADYQEDGCTVLSDEPFTAGTAVRLDGEDRMLLGEVVYCRREMQGYRSRLRFCHALNSLADLAALVEALLREQRTSTREETQAKLRA